ncbi:hypothetical protein SDC9_156026 [bioreactor metagenome]|uniref:Uncharacterized protein n=1 Tax=bioreactor metagenome TaxID=1076179 RepID=A0A645F3C3_9ZZZZ
MQSRRAVAYTKAEIVSGGQLELTAIRGGAIVAGAPTLHLLSPLCALMERGGNMFIQPLKKQVRKAAAQAKHPS